MISGSKGSFLNISKLVLHSRNEADEGSRNCGVVAGLFQWSHFFSEMQVEDSRIPQELGYGLRAKARTALECARILPARELE
jgi:hypothetical protein